MRTRLDPVSVLSTIFACSAALALGAATGCAKSGGTTGAVCGDGVVEGTEECDDGNTTAGDGCDETCMEETTVEGCGNGLLEPGEECDEGEENSDVKPDACRTDCTLPVCGDGVVDTGEDCDPPGAECSEECETTGHCGNTTCEPELGEDVDTCPEDCAMCGDGVCSSTEDVDGCPDDCAVCGDGVCSSTEDETSCPADCVECGDGVCSESEDADSCPDDCVECGDGICSATEDESTCPDDCAVCGDGICSATEDETTCSIDCAVCGDGICSSSEDESTCPDDCAVCGDGICSSTEDETSCPDDCVSCGDGICSATEDVTTCPDDCAVCGDGICSSTEDETSCPDDCALCQIQSDITSNIGDEPVIDNNSSGVDFADASCVTGTGPEHIYSLTPSFDGNLVVSLVNPATSYDTALAVRESSCENGTEVACNDDSYGLQSEVTFPVTSQTPYYVIVEGYSGDTGDYELTVHREGTCEGIGPVVDVTSDIGGATNTIDTSTGVASLSGTCGGSGAPEGRLTFTAPQDGYMTATTINPGTSYDTRIYVREDDCDSQSMELDCNDDHTGLQSRVDFPVTSSTLYHLIIDGFGSSSGDAEVNVEYLNPNTGSLGSCSSANTDIFAVSVQTGDELYVKGDTIDSATAGDLYMRVYDTDGTTVLGTFDDDFDCTYPPPNFRCPEGTITNLPNSGNIEVHIYSLSSCADTTNVGYELTVKVNGEFVSLNQTQDQ